MKLELAEFFEMIKKVNKLIVEEGVERLAEMVKDYDEIICTSPLKYEEACDAIAWLSRLKRHGKRMTLSDETAQNILKPFEKDKCKNDKWLVIAEWIIQLNRKQ